MSIVWGGAYLKLSAELTSLVKSGGAVSKEKDETSEQLRHLREAHAQLSEHVKALLIGLGLGSLKPLVDNVQNFLELEGQVKASGVGVLGEPVCPSPDAKSNDFPGVKSVDNISSEYVLEGMKAVGKPGQHQSSSPVDVPKEQGKDKRDVCDFGGASPRSPTVVEHGQVGTNGFGAVDCVVSSDGAGSDIDRSPSNRCNEHQDAKVGHREGPPEVPRSSPGEDVADAPKISFNSQQAGENNVVKKPAIDTTTINMDDSDGDDDAPSP